MICRKCGRDMPENALYCPWCGVSQQPKKSRGKRGNGTGSAYRRGNTWEARIVVRYDAVEVDGVKKKRPVWRTKGGFRTKRDALDYCAVLRSAVDRPKDRAPQLVEYWNTYRSGEYGQLSASKQSAYKTAWNKLANALQYRLVDQITVAELREVVSGAASTYYTVRDCKTVLTKLFELAGADGWCSKDLPSYIVLPKLEEREREAFTVEEQASLWKTYEAGDLRAAVPLLMICTGMMPGEIQALKVENVDLENRKILHAGIKTEVRRKSAIYLPDDVIPILEDLIANARPSGYLWPRNEKAWYESYYAVLESAGCRRLEPYCCRHTTATRLAANAENAPQTIRRMMRWSTTKMLDRYAHPADADIFKAANTITAPDAML